MFFDRIQSRYRSSQPLYELNYRILDDFLPDLSLFDSIETQDKVMSLSMRVNVLERGSYTTTIEIMLSPVTQIESIRVCQFKVRLCHDAKVAEVVEFQGERQFLAWYPNYPNPKMRTRDEKRQINCMLSDVLRFCAKSGISFEHLFA